MTKTTTILLAILFAISFVAAAQPLPHAFEGQIITEDNSSTNMKLLTARIDGAVTASTNITGNNYKITVVDNTGYGGDIEFFIGDEKAFESNDYTFKAFEITKINLTFETAPEQSIGSCGDGICAVGECSFCGIDCSVSMCNDNNKCDVAIGEDLVTAPNDCSVCGDGMCTGRETESSCAADCKASSSSSSGGGSKSGSSSGSSDSTTKTVSENTTSSISSLSIDELNEQIDTPIESSDSNKITGFAILDFKNNGPLNALILIALTGLIFFLVQKNKKKKAAEKIVSDKKINDKKKKVKKPTKKEIWKKGQSPAKKKSPSKK